MFCSASTWRIPSRVAMTSALTFTEDHLMQVRETIPDIYSLPTHWITSHSESIQRALSKLQLSWLVTTFVNNRNRREIGVNFLCLHSEAIKTLSPQRDVGTPNFQHIVNSKLSCPRRTMGGGAFWEDPFQPVHTRLKSFLHIHFQEEEEEEKEK